MLTLDERLMIGLKALERLKPGLRSRMKRQGANLEETFKDFISQDEEEGSLAQDPRSKVNSLQSVVRTKGPLPPYSIILGVCEDGLPFLLDLTNPAPGAVLVSGDTGCGKTRLVNAILSSATILNQPEQVNFHIIAKTPEEYSKISPSTHCQNLISTNDPTSKEVILEMANLVEERRHTNQRGPAIILAIDDLASLLQFNDAEVFTRLFGIIKHGPRSQVWTMAAISSEKIEKLDERLLSAFRTRILGNIHSSRLGLRLAGSANAGLEYLSPGAQFCAPFGDEWLRFWICDPED